ncbi:hypothetical protein E4T56_gene12146 [Termitomyces sp. T112]|nr:hypothetical protein E4T56_gene12146 [Termitomyces sp. T112]
MGSEFQALDLIDPNNVIQWLENKSVDQVIFQKAREGSMFLLPGAGPKYRDGFKTNSNDEVCHVTYRHAELRVHLLVEEQLGRITWTNFQHGDKIYTIKAYSNISALRKRCEESGMKFRKRYGGKIPEESDSQLNESEGQQSDEKGNSRSRWWKVVMEQSETRSGNL